MNLLKPESMKLERIFQSKNALAISTTLDIFKRDAISKQEAEIIIQGLKGVTVNLGGVTQSGYNCTISGDAGHTR